MKKYEVKIDAPVEVGREGGHLWFPTFLSLDDRRILCEATLAEDKGQGEWRARLYVSEDSGRSWRIARDIPSYGLGGGRLDDGRFLLHPYELWMDKPGDHRNASADGSLLIPGDSGEIGLAREKVRYRGFPGDWQDYLPGQLLVIDNGSRLNLHDGRLMGTVYGKFAGDARYRLCSVVSEDRGFTWRYQASIAGPDVAPGAKEGPNEAAIARCSDGRIICVFRVAMRVPFWSSYCDDEGATWSRPEEMRGVSSVKPQLVTLDNGAMLLSGGREGIFVWICDDGLGSNWRRFDIIENHNRHVSEECRYPAGLVGGSEILKTSATTAYTGLMAVGPDEALLCYDRLANGWGAAPGPHGEQNMIFCVRIQVKGY